MKGRIVSFFVVSLLALLGSCGKQEKGMEKPEHLLRLNLGSDPATMDPRKGGDVLSSHMHFLLFEGLTKLDAIGSIVPAQAEKIDISEDGRVYTFYLRDTYWSDGSSVTAYDFEKTWKDILDPAFPALNAHLFYPIKNAESAKKGRVGLDKVGITASNDKTLVVELDTPTPYFLELTSFCSFFPISSRIDAKYPEWAYGAGEHFVSNGPFLLKKWDHNDEILAVKNPLYWDQESVQLDAIHFSIIENEMTALQMFEQGELDMLGAPLSTLAIDALASLDKKGTLHKHPTAGTTHITFNTLHPPFNNPNIRKAFAYAINREEIVKNITQLDEMAATCIIPPVLTGNKMRSFFKDHDVEQARELLAKGLAELGMKKGDLEIALLYSTSDRNHKISQALQQQWKEVLGVSVSLENNDRKIVMDRLAKGNYSMAQTLWLAQYNDPMNILERFKFRENVKNYANWESAEYIDLLNASTHETGQARAETLEKAEKLFLNEMPVAPIYHWNLAFLAKPHLKNVVISPIGGVCFEKISIDQGFEAVK
jgi:oligopeptide transport system substrate-binding protein